jgi:RNA polymerase sigma-70 factor (ECF subfamily)
MTLRSDVVTTATRAPLALLPRPPAAEREPDTELITPAERRADALPLDDPEQMGALLSDLRPRLDAVALRFTRDPETARDVVQSAFEKVLRHGARFEGNSRVSTWIHRIVTNEALMWLRSERRRRSVHHDPVDPEQVSIPDPLGEPGDRLDRHHERQRLHDAIESLPESDREIVRACSLAGLSYAEYGSRNGVHTAAVKSRAFRARRRLRELLIPPESNAQRPAGHAQ